MLGKLTTIRFEFWSINASRRLHSNYARQFTESSPMLSSIARTPRTRRPFNRQGSPSALLFPPLLYPRPSPILRSRRPKHSRRSRVDFTVLLTFRFLIFIGVWIYFHYSCIPLSNPNFGVARWENTRKYLENRSLYTDVHYIPEFILGRGAFVEFVHPEYFFARPRHMYASVVPVGASE
ncbi:hypothetical protein RSAG8_04476, partial [Rhizoctonia solani AG-8 WAC10335]